MSDKHISPLRARMIEDMTVRNFTPHTQTDYVRAVKKLAAFLKRPPDTATAEDLRAFQVHLTGLGTTPSTMNAITAGLRFFFKVTLGKPEVTQYLAKIHEPMRLPKVLAAEDIFRMLEVTQPPKSKAMLAVGYGAGLRAMEVVALKIADIDSKRMLIRVERGAT
jgi:integrase/recombinase XerD